METMTTIISFTQTGEALAERLGRCGACGQVVQICRKDAAHDPQMPSLTAQTESAFAQGSDLIFVGALGIAVRAIAPHIRDKQTDPAVLVIDEQGIFVIPLLSGHLGGANEKAMAIAQELGAVPVITTATDLQGKFPVDLFAKEQNLGIRNKEGIAAVSAKALEGRPVTLSIQHFPPKGPVDVLVTDPSLDDMVQNAAEQNADAEQGREVAGPDCPLLEKGTIVLTARRAVLGIGCRKGKDADTIQRCVEEALGKTGIQRADLAAIASVTQKAEEPGILALSRRWHLPYLTFDAELLKETRGATVSSSFVEETVGVDNVCERAALLAAGRGAELILPRQTGEGVTLAIAWMAG